MVYLLKMSYTQSFNDINRWLSDKSPLTNENIGDYSISLNLVNNKIMKITIENNNNDFYSANIDLSTIKSTKNTDKIKYQKLKSSKIKTNGVISEFKPNLSYLSNQQKYSLIRNILTDNKPHCCLPILFFFDTNINYIDDDTIDHLPNNLYNYSIKKDKKNNIIITFNYSYIYSFIVEDLKPKYDFQNNVMLKVAVNEIFTLNLIKEKRKQTINNNNCLDMWNNSNPILLV
jgi:hypothetical protein